MEALEKAGKTAANLRCDFPPLPVIRFQTPDTKTSRVSPTYGFSHVGLGHLGIGGFSMCFHPPDPILPLLFRVTTQTYVREHFQDLPEVQNWVWTD